MTKPISKHPRGRGINAAESTPAGVTTTDLDATATLQSHGLNVKRVTRTPAVLIVEWRKAPTEHMISLRKALLPDAQDAT